MVAIALSNQSALRAFRESVDAVSGRANYQIASESGLDENLLLKLQPFWRSGLRFAPVIDVDGVLEPEQTPIRILAVDLLSDIHFRDYRYAEIQGSTQFYLDLFKEDSIILPITFAQEHHLRLDLRSRSTSSVTRTMMARAQARSMTAFSSGIGIADTHRAEAVRLPGRLTRVDLLVPDDRVTRRSARFCRRACASSGHRAAASASACSRLSHQSLRAGGRSPAGRNVPRHNTVLI